MTLIFLIAPLLAALISSEFVFLTFRRDLAASRKKLAGLSKLVETAAGRIEIAEIGTGFPVLFSHGAGGGFDQGLAIGVPIAAAGFRIIAVSRFGYLRSSEPKDCSPEAQADAYAALLKSLDIRRAAIIGGSAGGPSAMQFAIRHPEICAALVLVVPLAYHPEGQHGIVRTLSPFEEKLLMVLVGSNFIYWLSTKLAPKLIVRLTLGTGRKRGRTCPPARLYDGCSADQRKTRWHPARCADIRVDDALRARKNNLADSRDKPARRWLWDISGRGLYRFKNPGRQIHRL